MKQLLLPEKKKLTKVGLLFLLYNVPLTKMKELFNNDTRKYKAIVDNTYQSIDRDILDNFCSFLNVSSSLVLDTSFNNDSSRIYIGNKEDNNGFWMKFDTYIYLRSKRIIIDHYNKDESSIIHEINYEYIDKERFNKEGILYLLNEADLYPLINPTRLRINNTEIKKQVMINYEYYIHDYLRKFMSEEEIKESAKGLKYKEIVDIINEYIKDINKEAK